jgi:hypothetical protein
VTRLPRMQNAETSTVTLPREFSDVGIRTAAVPHALDGSTAAGVLWQAAPDRFLLHAPGVARFLVEDAARLTIDPVPGTDGTLVQRFVEMAPLAALAWQRQLLVFHAAAVARPEGAVLLAGDSGSGKSTLLGSLLARGWQMLADDLSVVRTGSDSPEVLPTCGAVALWPDAVATIDLSWTEGAATRDPSGRQVFPAGRAPASEPRPLLGIYWLSSHLGPEVAVESCPVVARLEAAMALSYNGRIAAVLLDPAQRLAATACLARCVPMHRVRRPRGRWSLDDIVDIVEQRLGAQLRADAVHGARGF